jgi:hypothetical protein
MVHSYSAQHATSYSMLAKIVSGEDTWKLSWHSGLIFMGLTCTSGVGSDCMLR